MTRAHSAEERAAALARLDAGESPTALARSLGIDRSTLRLWRARAGSARAVPIPARAETTPAGPALSNRQETAAPEPAGSANVVESPAVSAPTVDVSAVRAALESAGLPTGAPEQAAPQSALPEPLPPLPTPDEVLGILEAVQGIAVRLMVALKRIELPEHVLVQLVKLTPDERASLRPLAPAAAPYIQRMLGSSGKGGAIMFGVVGGLGLLGRWRAIKSAAEVLEARAGGPIGAASAGPE